MCENKLKRTTGASVERTCHHISSQRDGTTSIFPPVKIVPVIIIACRLRKLLCALMMKRFGDHNVNLRTVSSRDLRTNLFIYSDQKSFQFSLKDNHKTFQIVSSETLFAFVLLSML